MIGCVHVSCANVYRRSTFHSEVDTQVVLWEEVQIIGSEHDFYEIVTEDGYRGWINRHQIIEGSGRPENHRIITSPLVRFYEEADAGSPVIRDGVAGAYAVIQSEQSEWLETCFPDGQTAWLKAGHCRPMPELSRSNLIEYAKTLIGRPYFWGGKTPKGLDCSGFMQLVHKVFGVNIRRDAWMQFEDARHISDDPLAGQPGDMMFFAEGGSRITHVGFCMGEGKLIHARGLVRINSLRKEDALFSDALLKDFVAIRSFMDES